MRPLTGVTPPSALSRSDVLGPAPCLESSQLKEGRRILKETSPLIRKFLLGEKEVKITKIKNKKEQKKEKKQESRKKEGIKERREKGSEEGKGENTDTTEGNMMTSRFYEPLNRHPIPVGTYILPSHLSFLLYLLEPFRHQDKK